MKLLFDTKNIRNLVKIILNIPSETKKVYASIAYSSSDFLLKEVINKKIELEWYGLFNYDEATKLELLGKALSNKQYIRFYPIVDFFHPKVVYFENYGIYIGSANMTEKALYYNIEAGVFLTMEEIQRENYLPQILDYFNELKSLSTPMTDDDYEIYSQFIKHKKEISPQHNEMEENLKRKFRDRFPHYIKPKEGAKNFGKSKDNKQDVRKKAFIQEWKSTQHELKTIMDKIQKQGNLPNWIPKTDAYGIVADQFLHSYYYSKIKEENDRKSLEIVEKLFKQNTKNKEKALEDALNWWRSLKTAPFGEDEHINQWCPRNRSIYPRTESLI
ncbi:hypothetical protein N752_24470 [Desulforamulus aquiferis]|nr:phospholipase D family protein [Desulforamulus aquiferis]RYD02487.1 hypothetical protein N752_24470 [Desulforamulus aquiferis]